MAEGILDQHRPSCSPKPAGYSIHKPCVLRVDQASQVSASPAWGHKQRDLERARDSPRRSKADSIQQASFEDGNGLLAHTRGNRNIQLSEGSTQPDCAQHAAD
jgi:hypothetical protein